MPMRRQNPVLLPLLLAIAFSASCADGRPQEGEGEGEGDGRAAAETGRACADPAAREAAERFARALKHVSVLAPDSVLRGQIEEVYGPLVEPPLLDSWIAAPDAAPGRAVSSPWPDRIEVTAVTPVRPGECLVTGDVIHVTSAEAGEGGAAARLPVAMTVRRNGGWRVAAYGERTAAGRDTGSEASDTPGGVTAPLTPADPAQGAAAADVVRAYYAAIDARDFVRAHALWEGNGAASGQTLAAFRAGFAETADVRAEVGVPGGVEAAAGSRYVVVPVTIHATTTEGTTQRFEGTYTLRRSVVDGASASQRRWRIYTADLERAG